MASAAVASQRAFGLDRGLPFPVSDIPGADAVLLVGANPAETMPPLVQYFDDQRTRGGTLIVADPRRTATAALARVHLQLAPGTDAALANGLLHVAVRDRLIDRDFIATRTTGFEAVRHVVGSYWPDRVERITGVPARQIVEAAHVLGEATTGMIMTARGPEQQSRGVDNVLAFVNLALALGKVGKPHCGFGCITGQGNGQGGREHGQKSDQLPGYRRLGNPATANTSPPSGAWRRRICPGPARRRARCSTSSARQAECACSSSWARTWSFRRRTRARSSRGSRSSICWSSRISSCPRRRSAQTWSSPPASGPRRRAR